MIVQENVSLKPYNTFSIEVKAPYFVNVTSEQGLMQACQRFPQSFILGGGSNILFTKDLEVPVIRVAIQGIEVVKEDSHNVWVKAYAGELWHHLVLYTLERGWGGLENLSLIPGSVGASVVQNIGAYGVEIKDVMHSCEVLCLQTLSRLTLSNTDCKFGYRESVFKNEAKGKYLVLSVTYKLTKNNHILRLNYGGLAHKFSDIEGVTPKMISDEVIAIRKEKLPDPKVLGNCGSFFKNPVVDRSVFEVIRISNPDMPFYEVSDTLVKVPAGWLIEQCGMKGFRDGDAGVHTRQALVLVNYGNATGEQIYHLALKIRSKVYEKFNISLEMEVNVM